MPLPYVGPAPSTSTDVATKGYADSVGGGGGISMTAVSVTLDVNETAIVTDASVSSTSKIAVFQGIASDTDENTPDMDNVQWVVVSRATGSFTIQAIPTITKSKIQGVFKIYYLRS